MYHVQPQTCADTHTPVWAAGPLACLCADSRAAALLSPTLPLKKRGVGWAMLPEGILEACSAGYRRAWCGWETISGLVCSVIPQRETPRLLYATALKLPTGCKDMASPLLPTHTPLLKAVLLFADLLLLSERGTRALLSCHEWHWDGTWGPRCAKHEPPALCV